MIPITSIKVLHYQIKQLLYFFHTNNYCNDIHDEDEIGSDGEKLKSEIYITFEIRGNS